MKCDKYVKLYSTCGKQKKKRNKQRNQTAWAVRWPVFAATSVNTDLWSVLAACAVNTDLRSVLAAPAVNTDQPTYCSLERSYG